MAGGLRPRVPLLCLVVFRSLVVGRRRLSLPSCFLRLCLVLGWGRLCWLRGLNLVGGRGATLAPLAEVRDDGDAHGGQGEGCGEQEGQHWRCGAAVGASDAKCCDLAARGGVTGVHAR